ncbi:hypothetical protein [Deinococcus planocerae]|uniref:hypothetical protein n=1 Tax=Deinococcus planocerae TaxID=1737569 RepID=UPI000C7F4F9B|nr:hypothetical protein [Deinococcus planocerae]
MEEISASEFWQWAYSDFLSNALRGVLAEYIVARAVGCTHRPRVEWDAYDLKTDSGLRIEVKSAAYLQSWQQKRLSPIRFDIGMKRGWDAEANVVALESSRSADVYVFCVFAAQERETADPLELSQWFFLVCSTERLAQRFGCQKSVSLSSLEAMGLERVPFEVLRAHVQLQAASPSPEADR